MPYTRCNTDSLLQCRVQRVEGEPELYWPDSKIFRGTGAGAAHYYITRHTSVIISNITYCMYFLEVRTHEG